jgi:nucleoside diphosphate kinase
MSGYEKLLLYYYPRVNYSEAIITKFSCVYVNVVQSYFEDLVNFMTSGPSHVLVITKGQSGNGIIDEWRQLLGPPSVEQARETAPNR